ncbi:MAG TPA: hypothetical protein VJN50_08070 [Actinomycetota bacterium]|nr:hypothetical protein [Actinomycetota bacterium]
MSRSRLPALFLVLLAACGGDLIALPSEPPATSPAATTPPTLEPTESPTGFPTPIPPAWAEPIESQGIYPVVIPNRRFAPPGAEVADVWHVPKAAGIPDQVVAAWFRGADPLRQRWGLALWQAYPDERAWRVTYAFEDRVERGVLGITATFGDLTADGHDEILTFESTGGSGGCGAWRVLATDDDTLITDEIWHEQTCDAQVEIDAGRLVVAEAVYEPEDAHCCPSRRRTTALAWTGDRFEVETRVVEEVDL